MNTLMSRLAKLKDNLQSAAFFVSRGASEKEIHKELIQSLVLLAQIEADINEVVKFDDTADRQRLGQDSKIEREIKKVQRKVPKWFNNPSQKNSTILITFLQLADKYTDVTLSMLRSKCSAIKDFDGNYNQMKNFGEKNHGKVFEEKDGVIRLWEPVNDYIMGLYSEYNKGARGLTA